LRLPWIEPRPPYRSSLQQSHRSKESFCFPKLVYFSYILVLHETSMEFLIFWTSWHTQPPSPSSGIRPVSWRILSEYLKIRELRTSCLNTYRYELRNSMRWSPYWVANSHSRGQEITASNGTRSFTAILATDHSCSLSWAIRIHVGVLISHIRSLCFSGRTNRGRINGWKIPS
jgi:hypothetical protein